LVLRHGPSDCVKWAHG